MPAIIKTKFRVRSAKEFVNSFPASTATSGENYYLFVGRPTPWNAPDNIVWPWSQTEEPSASTNADLYPPVPRDTNVEEADVWDEMLGLKRINRGDVSLVIPRSNWDPTGKTVYSIFSDFDSDLYNHPTPTDVANLIDPTLKPGNFYALNTQNDLFVCLYNNNYGPSTIEPILLGDATSPVDYSDQDGYVWKYITSITSGDAVKFLTDSWIPVKTLVNNDSSKQWQVQEAAEDNAGSVLSVIILNFNEATATWPETGTYKIEITGTNTCKVLVAAGLRTPSSQTNVYVDYELKVGVNRYRITNYSYVDASSNTLTIDGSFVESTGATPDANIQPRLEMFSNSTHLPLPEFTPVVGADGKISKIEIDEPGRNATFAALRVMPLPTHQAGTVPPAFKPVLAPVDGLGKDPEKDLGAFFAMVSTQIRYSEAETSTDLSDFPVKNDYRQLGILRNVVKYDQTFCSENTLRATKRANITFSESIGIEGDPGFKSDEVLVIKNAGIVVGQALCTDFKFFDRAAGDDEITGQVTFIQNFYTGYKELSGGHTLVGKISGAEAIVDSIDSEELKKFQGEIFYLENRRPVLRSVDQVEDIKTIIEF